MEATRTLESVYDELCKELDRRGVEYRKPDAYGFVSGCWPTESTVEELADDWQEEERQSTVEEIAPGVYEAPDGTTIVEGDGT